MNLRTKKQDGGYFSLARSAVNDSRLSYKAIGLHTYLMSKADGWEAQEGDLTASHREGRAAVRSAMQELIDCGYMVRVQIRGAGGRVADWRVDTYESPDCNPHYQDGQPPRLVIEDLAGNVVRVVADDSEPQSENRIVDAGEPQSENQIVESPQFDFQQVENRTGVNNIDVLDIEFSPPPKRTRPRARAREDAPTPTPAAPPKRTTPKAASHVPVNSPHLESLRGVRLAGGYIPEGTGQNAVQVYYERFRMDDPDARLSRPQEDDLVRGCPDLDKLRRVVVAYSRAGYRARRVDLILDWYRAGIPDRGGQASQPGQPPPRYTQQGRQRGGYGYGRNYQQPAGKAPERTLKDELQDEDDLQAIHKITGIPIAELRAAAAAD